MRGGGAHRYFESGGNRPGCRTLPLCCQTVDVFGALWVDVPEAAGAIATALGLLGAVSIAVFYGRKATANLTAAAYLTDGAVLLSTRPSVCAVGLFRLRFAVEEGATIRVTEMVQIEDGLRDGRRSDAEAVFGDSFVEGGETLMTTVVFPLGRLPQEVVGWRVSFGVTVQRWPSGRQWSWADQVFVARPTGIMGTGKEDRHGEGFVDDQGRAVRADEESEG